MSECFVGVDVSKAALDVHALPGKSVRQFANDPAGHAATVEAMRPLRVTRLVVAATGGFEVAAVGVPGAVVNPRQARDVATAAGLLAKADRMDARALATFG